jgi:hypothetical protein
VTTGPVKAPYAGAEYKPFQRRERPTNLMKDLTDLRQRLKDQTTHRDDLLDDLEEIIYKMKHGGYSGLNRPRD